MLDDERVERLNVGIESEIFLRRNILTPGRTVSQPGKNNSDVTVSQCHRRHQTNLLQLWLLCLQISFLLEVSGEILSLCSRD